MGLNHRQDSLMIFIVGAVITYCCSTVFNEEEYYAPRKFIVLGPALLVFGAVGMALPAHYFFKIDPKYSDLPIDVLMKTEKTMLFWVVLGLGCVAGIVTWQVFERLGKVW